MAKKKIEAPAAPAIPPGPPPAPGEEGICAEVSTPVSTTEQRADDEVDLWDDMYITPVMERMEVDALRYLRKGVRDAIQNDSRGKIIGTGVLGVDIMIHRGFPFGTSHEFFGLSKTAKSYLIQKVALEAQTRLPDCYVVFLDRENAYSKPLITAMGFDLNRTIIVPATEIPEPDNAFDVMRELATKIQNTHIKLLAKAAGKEDGEEDKKDKKKDPTNPGGKESKKTRYCRDWDEEKSPHIVFAIDSIPAFAEKLEMVEDQGRRAKKWHAMLRRVTAFLDKRTMLLMSNHIIYKPGAYGNPESKTSGTAIDYYRDCGLKLMKRWDLRDDNGTVIGVMIGAEVDKTRNGIASGRTMFPIWMKGGAPRFSGILEYMAYLGIASLNNATTFKENGHKGQVWATYNVEGVPRVLCEKDPEQFEKDVIQYDLLGKIGRRQKALFTKE